MASEEDVKEYFEQREELAELRRQLDREVRAEAGLTSVMAVMARERAEVERLLTHHRRPRGTPDLDKVRRRAVEAYILEERYAEMAHAAALFQVGNPNVFGSWHDVPRAAPTEPSPLVFDLAFIDVETSHLDERVGQILELCIVRVDSRTMVEKARYHKWFLPTKPVDPDAARVNGYTEEKWRMRGAEKMRAEDLHLIAGVLEGAALTGWNVKFDRGFLWAAYDRMAVEHPNADYHMLDVAVFAWPLVVEGRLRGMSLKHTRKLFGMEGEQSHTAAGDVADEIAAYKIYMSMYMERPVLRWWPGTQPR